jgi:hypothetical protein
VGILLTGMGKDGANGLKTLRNSGALTITQDSESCVVYGMPRLPWNTTLQSKFLISKRSCFLDEFAEIQRPPRLKWVI